MKIVINSDVGHFQLSAEAASLYLQRSTQLDGESQSLASVSRRVAQTIKLRSDPALVAIVDELGPQASGEDAHLEIAEAPNNGRWHLLDVCGIEVVVVD